MFADYVNIEDSFMTVLCAVYVRITLERSFASSVNMICKNCGEKIYQEKDGTWYHSLDEYAECGTTKAVNPALFFKYAEPDETIQKVEK
jgi:hypothetical protein